MNGTSDYGLWYPKDTNFTLSAYTYANWVECIDEKKSTTGGEFFLGCKLMAWLRKKKDSFSLSTVGAKYIAIALCCTQVLWMKQILKDITIVCDDLISIFYDNKSTINISKNPMMHSSTKHISIIYHFLREKVMKGEVKLEYVPKKDQIVDIFIKALPKNTFEYL